MRPHSSCLEVPTTTEQYRDSDQRDRPSPRARGPTAHRSPTGDARLWRSAPHVPSPRRPPTRHDPSPRLPRGAATRDGPLPWPLTAPSPQRAPARGLPTNPEPRRAGPERLAIGSTLDDPGLAAWWTAGQTPPPSAPEAETGLCHGHPATDQVPGAPACLGSPGVSGVIRWRSRRWLSRHMRRWRCAAGRFTHTGVISWLPRGGGEDGGRHHVPCSATA
jgi:hypothetical protein